ncbi:ATP-binding protein [Flavobacterium degerlachei]|jgi:signal transduction histidine kinase/CheY-like chemotaxis protein|uniref:histidine kinase n=1 Tax=Flavobacterium degerlachei TaxID=229203 RepID=A0A1H2W1M0_9FLAO|nr:ATP-binding protein [Flavobacterium degerlachei]SDW73999.1 PAS domain-containing protein [Flavobacterium degerlachei]
MTSNDYIDFFKQSPSLSIVLDTNFNVVAATDNFLQVTMTKRENITDKNIFDVFPENPNEETSYSISNLRMSLNSVLLKKKTDTIDIIKYDIQKPESEGGGFERRYWKAINSPILDSNNNINYIMLLVEDITKNKKLRYSNSKLKKSIKLLEESYGFSEEIIATMMEPMLVLNEDLKIKSASNSFCLKYAISKEEIEGASVFAIDNNRWDLPELRNLLDKMLSKKIDFHKVEISCDTSSFDRKTIVVSANYIFQKTHDEKTILLAIQDVSEVRRLSIALQNKEKKEFEKRIEIQKNASKEIEDSNKRFNMVLLQSPFAIAILKSKDMVVSLANDSIKEMWGKGKNVEGKKFNDVLPELIDKEFPLLLDNVFTTGIPFYGNELLAPILHDGELRDAYFNFVYQPYYEADETISGVTIIAYDVTNQVLAKNELVESKINAELKTKIAEEAVKSKQQFLSNMSHEIRTPMNAIIGFTNVILKTQLDKSQTEYINAIKESGDALIILINDILDIAKVDAGKMTFDNAPFKLSKSISTILHLFEQKMKEKNLELIQECDPSIPKFLIGDPMRLRQIILNLMSNAIKFTSKGRISVKVSLLDEDSERVTIEFLITDTGIGVPEDRLAHIFNNFEQATKGTTSSYGGTGLGLAIVKQLVELQGGSIIASSEEGEGSTFGFTMSFEKPTSSQEDIKEDISPILPFINNDSTAERVKVLVVEDMTLNQLLLKIILLDFGYDIDVADNGKIAIEKFQNNSYDIILMDLQMPEMNGFEATSYIREVLESKIPIIALTADVTTADVAKCKAVGMNDYISKPIDEKLLLSKINKHINLV